MNTFEAGVVARLKASKLLDVAERAAKRVELRLADCIAPGEVTGGHRALWLMLGQYRSPSQVAVLVGFSERDVLLVFREAPPVAQATPASERRAVRRETHTEREGLRRRVKLLEETVATDDNAASLKRRVATLEAQVKSLVEQLKILRETKTAVRSRSTQIAMDVCAARGVSLQDVRSRSHAPYLVAARIEIMRRLALELQYSPSAIAKVLSRDRSTVLYHMNAQKEAA